MNVALVGNMNNGMFSLARHLRDAAYKVNLLFAPPSADHFHPKADTFELEDLRLCKEVSWLRRGLRGLDASAVRDQLRGYDAVLAQGMEAAALHVAGVRADIYLPYGSDLLLAGGVGPIPAGTGTSVGPRWQAGAQALRAGARSALADLPTGITGLRRGPTSRQVRGVICEATHLIVDHQNSDFDRILGRLPLSGTVHRSAWPFLYPHPYRQRRSAPASWDAHWRCEVDRVRSENELVLLYHGRHEWATYVDDFSFKNTHHLIEGFKLFIDQHPGRRAALILVEYGSDVQASKRLIHTLGLAPYVTWLPRMYRKDVMYLVNAADLCAGEFGMSYFTFGTILEAMSLGKPVIHHRDDSAYPEKKLYPLLNAREPQEIADSLAEFVRAKDKWIGLGTELEQWVDEHITTRPLELIESILQGRQPKVYP